MPVDQSLRESGSDESEKGCKSPDATVSATEGHHGRYLTGWRLSALLLCLGVSTFLTGLVWETPLLQRKSFKLSDPSFC